MANTAAHLLVARGILEKRPDMVTDRGAYYLGCVAPDAIESKSGSDRADKKRVHLRDSIPDMDWLEPELMERFQRRVDAFTKEHIKNKPPCAERDFMIGYLVHLFTDRVNHATVRLIILGKLLEEGINDGGYDFFYKVINDLEALDYALLQKEPGLAALFEELLDAPVRYCLPGMIEKEYLEKSLKWWREEYLPRIKTKRAVYASEEDIYAFASRAVEEISRELEGII